VKAPELRLLVSAYACEPGRGSEPGVGWTWVHEIAQLAEAWVVTRSNNRPTIESALATAPLPNVHWIYFDFPRWMRFWKKGGPGLHTYYFLWQVGAYFVARRLAKQIPFDYIHHLTFGTYWTPSLLTLLPIPFIWGPVGGAESTPSRFRKLFGRRAQVYELFRDLVRTLGNLNPLVRLTVKRAVVIISKTEDTKRQLEAIGARQVAVISEVGLPASEIRSLAAPGPRQDGTFRLCSVGRLIHWKGFELALQAFARMLKHEPESKYWIIGDGAERRRLENLAQRLGISPNVVFTGALGRAQALEKMKQCDALVHPSLHDSGGWACVEAMAAGLPVICLDLGGPAVQVTPECGVKIPTGSPEQVIEDMAEAMIKLAEDTDYRESLQRGAMRRVQEYFSWDYKRDWLRRLYSVEDAEVIANKEEVVAS
jgi:glycosyltransferase involved in cell wall biosynthesis